MHKIKLECLALAKPYAQNIDELFDYGDKIQNYIFDATTNDVRRVFYVDVNDMPPEEAEATLKKAMETVSGDAIAINEAVEEVPAWAKATVAAASEDFASRANSELAPVSDTPSLCLLRDIDDSVLHDAIISAPVVPSRDLREDMHFKNYTIRGLDGKYTLRPILQHAAQMFVDGHDVVLNAARQIGTTNLIAALARHFMVRSAPATICLKETILHRVLVLTNSSGARSALAELIDDATVNVMTFAEAAKSTPHEKGYSIVLIDNAAFIPYASENQIMSFVSASGMPDKEGNLIPPRIFMASVPGQEMGLFHRWFTSDDENITPLTISWKDAGMMDKQRALKFRQEIGSESFDNQHDNKFRPVE